MATYAYDTQGRMAAVTPGTAGVPTGSFTYSYLGASAQVASLAMPGSVTTTRTYDALGRLATVTNSGPGAAPGSTVSAFAYTVDAHDRRTRVDLADGGRWEYTYDGAGQVVGGVRYAPRWPDNSAQVLATYGYQYDPMGNPTQRSEDAGVSVYTYNNLNQLVTGNWSGTLSAFGWTRTADLSGVSVTAGQQTESATVFQNGDWTAKGFSLPAGDTALTVTRTAADQTTVQAQTAVNRPADATQFTHDLNGNMLALDGWALAWDDENRLVSAVKSGTVKVEYVYDGLGRRRLRRVYSWNAQTEAWALSAETRFVWDSWLLLRETTATPGGGVTFTRTYTCGLDLSGQLGGEGLDPMSTAGGIGGILAMTSSSSALPAPSSALFLYDGNGNVANLADAGTAAVLATYEYGPFGNTLVASGPLADTNPIRFSTKYAEAAHGPDSAAGPDLYYYGRRYYSPGLGRWVSRDPIEEKGGDNLQAMCQNAPVNRFDLLGQMQVCCSPVRGNALERRFRHCDIGNACAPGEDAFPIWRDTSSTRRMDNGMSCSCASAADIESCLQRHHYSARPRGTGDDWWLPWPLNLVGNNCQTSVVLSVGNCCLRSSWRPDWYAGDPRGRCLHGFYIEEVFICTQWELPEWRDDEPPAGPDIDEPHWPRPRPPRPPRPPNRRP